MTLTLTILGSGSSAGVPRPALGWGACDPSNPKNRRRRCSLLVERTSHHGTTRIVIDTAPDLREQLISTDVDHIDAVFLTHEHADQTHGMDDLRSVVIHMRKRIPVYFNQSTAKDIMARFSYCFIAPEGSDYPPILSRHRLQRQTSRAGACRGWPQRRRPPRRRPRPRPLTRTSWPPRPRRAQARQEPASALWAWSPPCSLA